MSITIGFTGVAFLFVLLLLRIPVALALIAVSFGGVAWMLGLAPAVGIISNTPFSFVSSWSLSAVPMFLLMGFVSYHAGLTGGLFDAAKAVLRRIPGALAISSIFACSGFAAVCGSSLATAASMGRIAIPEMVKSGYSPSFASGAIAAGGTIGALIQPSILMIIYGVFAETSVIKVFMGGITIGLLTALSYVVVVLLTCWLRPDIAPPKPLDADDIDTLDTAESPTGVACVGLYLVVVSNDSCSLHYALRSEVDDVDFDEAWLEAAAGFVATGCPRDIWSYGNGAFIVGDGGYVYALDADPSAGVTVLEAGVATAQNLLAVHALSDKFAVAGGNNGALIQTTDGVTWTALDAFVGIGVNLTCVWCKDERDWFVGTSTGQLWATRDGGLTWALNGFPGSGTGYVWDIAFATASVGYLSHATAAGRGRLLRTINSGYNWVICPETAATMPLADRFTALAACPYDPDYVVAGGLGDNGTDGILVVGQN